MQAWEKAEWRKRGRRQKMYRKIGMVRHSGKRESGRIQQSNGAGEN